MIDLTEEQIERYSRHILLQDVGLEGQEKLLNAKVLIIGAGGLGSPVALYAGRCRHRRRCCNGGRRRGLLHPVRAQRGSTTS